MNDEQSFREALARIAAGFYTEKGAENHAKDILRLVDTNREGLASEGSGKTAVSPRVTSVEVPSPSGTSATLSSNEQVDIAEVYAWVRQMFGGHFPSMDQLATEFHRRCARETKAPLLFPLDDETRFILGRPNFTLAGIAARLRTLGHSIAFKAEDQQAAVIHWMLGIYFEHGQDWRTKADEVLRSQVKTGAES